MIPRPRSAAIAFGLVLALLPTPLRAQAVGASGVVAGTVADEAGRPIEGVSVTVEGTARGALTDAEGGFRVAGVPPGPQVLRAERIGYATARVSLLVPVSDSVRQDVRLSERPLQMEALTVTADAVGRARGEVGTATVVLELLPGAELAAPGLSTVQQVSLRAVPTSGSGGGVSATDLAAFGTLVVFDGVPLTNNANLQTLGPRGVLVFPSAAGGGVDLRHVPAATLERVEVIRGVPSARVSTTTAPWVRSPSAKWPCSQVERSSPRRSGRRPPNATRTGCLLRPTTCGQAGPWTPSPAPRRLPSPHSFSPRPPNGNISVASASDCLPANHYRILDKGQDRGRSRASGPW